jgi:hypothetical protein
MGAAREIVVTLVDGAVTAIRDINGQGTNTTEGSTDVPPRRHVATILYFTTSECYVIRSGGTERKICY